MGQRGCVGGAVLGMKRAEEWAAPARGKEGGGQAALGKGGLLNGKSG